MAGDEQLVVYPHLQNSADHASVIIEALKSCLMEESATNKAPRGLDRALEALPQSDGVSRAFLDAGFLAWYAYFITTERNQSIKDLASGLSSPSLRYIVNEVSKIRPSDSLRKRIDHILSISNRGVKRSQLLASNNVRFIPYLEPNPQPPKRARPECVQRDISSLVVGAGVMTQEKDFSDALPLGGAGQQNAAAARVAESASCNEALGLATFEIDPRYEYAWPKARYLPFVFPHYMCATIVKNAELAAIMLSYPTDPALCRLVFDISAGGVQHIAKELFGIHLQVIRGRRCIVFEYGATVEINSSVTLVGATVTSMDKLFGEMVGNAFRLSPGRMEELSTGEMLSKSLSMEVWSTSDRPSRLSLMLEAQQLASIYAKLWPPTAVMPS